MRPLLNVLTDDEEHSIRSIRDDLAAHFSLSSEEIEELIPSGRVTTFKNRVGWATTYLYRAGLIARPKRATYRITPRGHEVLTGNPERVDLAVLSQFDEFEEFRRSKVDKSADSTSASTPDEQTPEERIETAYRELRSALAGELIDRVQDQTAEFSSNWFSTSSTPWGTAVAVTEHRNVLAELAMKVWTASFAKTGWDWT